MVKCRISFVSQKWNAMEGKKLETLGMHFDLVLVKAISSFA